MKPLVIFGTGDIGALAAFYFTHDAGRRVAAFTADGAFIKEDSFQDLPVVPFETIAQSHPPQDFDLFVAVSYSGLNRLRAARYAQAKEQGYRLPSYVSTKATTFPGFTCGDNCLILEDNTIQPFARIGNDVVLWSGNHIGHHSVIRDHAFVASHVVISGGVEIGERCFVGVNATLRDHIRVGADCIIGAGVVLLEDVEPEGVYKAVGTERSRIPSSRLKRI